ncbi:hypothetical protein QBC46DRAFT_416359 [Diplogelasinospora grovesii]|uniref:Uncharacterized protein n=1 Tax=Diplogelasinospora grovesii TaxID=303347 RepID=A0AAN6S1T4_9PEZI|nr:hypothetical protein QBC46DRAFT_416359 [Diplogelasinospora grovesii]
MSDFATGPWEHPPAYGSLDDAPREALPPYVPYESAAARELPSSGEDQGNAHDATHAQPQPPYIFPAPRYPTSLTKNEGGKLMLRILEPSSALPSEGMQWNLKYTNWDCDRIIAAPGPWSDSVEQFEQRGITHMVVKLSLLPALAAPPFSSATLDFELQSSCHGVQMRPLHQRVVIRMAPPYKHRPASQFLLVVNSGTPRGEIMGIKRYIETELHLDVDIVDVCQSGVVGRIHDILARYRGKTVMLACNLFTLVHGVTHRRYIWDLLDPAVVRSLAKRHTSFLFLSSGGDQAPVHSLQSWWRYVAYPEVHGEHSNGRVVDCTDGGLRIVCLPGTCKCNVVSNKGWDGELRAAQLLPDETVLHPGGDDDDMIQFRVTKSVPRFTHTTTDLEGSMARLCKRTCLKLLRNAPAQRFLVTYTRPRSDLPVGGDAQGQARLGINTGVARRGNYHSTRIIAEGLPRSANCIVSTQPVIAAWDHFELTHHQMHLTVAGLPFDKLCRLFWNMLPLLRESRGVSVRHLYAGSGIPFRVPLDTEEDSFISPKISAYIATAIQQALTRDMDIFQGALRSKMQWEHVGRGCDCRVYCFCLLPRLSTFLATTPEKFPAFPQDPADKEMVREPVVAVLSTLYQGLRRIGGRAHGGCPSSKLLELAEKRLDKAFFAKIPGGLVAEIKRALWKDRLVRRLGGMDDMDRAHRRGADGLIDLAGGGDPSEEQDGPSSAVFVRPPDLTEREDMSRENRQRRDKEEQAAIRAQREFSRPLYTPPATPPP